MNRLLTIFRDKRFRYGTMSTAMMVLAVLLFGLVNLVAGGFNRTWDLTRDRFFTLSSQTQTFLDNLQYDVNIFYIAQTGDDMPMIARLLEEIDRGSSRINYEVRDPMINPMFVNQFAAGNEGIPLHSVIVESGGRHQVITFMDMFSVTVDPQWGGITGIHAINIEREVVTAIHVVTQGVPAVVYHERQWRTASKRRLCAFLAEQRL